MSILETGTQSWHVIRRAGFYVGVLSLLLLPGSTWAQETADGSALVSVPGPAVPEVVEIELMDINALPEMKHLAAALSDRQSRIETLLTMIAVERLLGSVSPGGLSDPEPMRARFRDDRAWLDRLAGRYTNLPVRGSQLDPAAWLVMRELSQHRLIPGIEASPLGPDLAGLTRQLFDRSNERLAAAVLPEVLQRIETRSPALWMSLLDTATVNESLLAVIPGLYTAWFYPWVTVELPELVDRDEEVDAIDLATTGLRALAGAATMSGPVDENRLKQLRFDLLSAIPSLDEVQSRDAGYLLVLANAIDGLQDDQYLAFTESLFWVISDLLLNERLSLEAVRAAEQSLTDLAQQGQAEAEAETGTETTPKTAVGVGVTGEQSYGPRSVLPALLSELLPWFSNSYAGAFSAVDSRINASLAAVFDAVQYLQGMPRDSERLVSLQQNIGDAIAQLVLQIPDMSYYFDQPVRRRIAEEIDVCVSMAANIGGPDAANLTREQFDGCLSSLVEMSESLVVREELSGDVDGPFGAEQVRRELMMPPWQRINFSLGYLHERFPTHCELPDQSIPNPLEWSALATMITWFARQAPVYFQTPENEALVLSMRQQGLDLVEELARQVDCISGEGAGVNDPVRRSIANYRLALDELTDGIRAAELDFRASRLKPGADVVLHGDASQSTAYRAQDLVIGPCDAEQVCGMSGQLEATRALIGLFPDPYLIADQTGLGSVEICYQNMRWVNRREVPVRPDDSHVSNFFGQLSFEIVGRYLEQGEVTEVFGSTLVSPDEYHYLFAAATDEVREDDCPTEWVGSQIVTLMGPDEEFRVVPNRLTYLAAAREKPSGIMEANWSKGAEWRDWFVTDLGVTPHTYAGDEMIGERVNQHLRALHQAEQSMLYAALLRPQSRSMGSDAVESLLDLQEELTGRKALVRSYLNLFYPEAMIDSDHIRGSLEGYDSLLDTAVLRRFREAGVAVAAINETGLERIEQLQSDWSLQPEAVRRSGSVASGVAHAIIRLNALYLEFFVLPAKKPETRDDPTNSAFLFD